jgi:hypothetical protein
MIIIPVYIKYHILLLAVYTFSSSSCEWAFFCYFIIALAGWWFEFIDILFFANTKIILSLKFMCIVEFIEKFVVVVSGWVLCGRVVVECELCVLLWSKPFHSGLSFGLGPSQTIILSKESENAFDN